VAAGAARAAAGGDPKLERLRGLLADRRPTLVFSTRRETVRHLRDRLAPPPVAWCTGERAGLGLLPAPRAAVLGWFRDELAWEAPGLAPPSCLVVTDVAAEGLDLRRAARVVHYDLPWTPMRLEQREGRAVRLGSARELVEVVRFIPPPALDAALELGERLRRKAVLPALAGLGADGVRLWRWRSALVDQLGDGPAVSGSALACGSSWVPGTAAGAPSRGGGVLAGFELLALRQGERERVGSVVGWLAPDGTWSEDESVVAERLRAAAACDHRAPPTPDAIRRALHRLVGPVRARLALAAARRWTAAEPDTAARRLALRLGELVRAAARRRDGGELARLERALAFVSGGHTAGEAVLVRRLADAEAPAFAAGLAGIPATSARWDAIDVRLTGLVIFED